jgi:hypothetical protein
MATAVLSPDLQSSVDRFARSLIVPSRLLALHPRRQGHAGNAAALAPAITLGVLSAFEGFAEDYFATALYLRNQSFAQIAKKMNLSNPDVVDIEDLTCREFPALKSSIGKGFTISVWKPTPSSNTNWKEMELDWAGAKNDSRAWMQVRHCLAHGLASGWSSEIWPGPVRKDVPHATSVLRPMKYGKHSLTLHGAISCARIYRAAAEHIATIVASEMKQVLDWSNVREFDLRATPTA